MLAVMGHLKQNNKAKHEIEAIHEKKPGFGIIQARQLLDLKDEFRNLILDGLKKAGLPE